MDISLGWRKSKLRKNHAGNLDYNHNIWASSVTMGAQTLNQKFRDKTV